MTPRVASSERTLHDEGLLLSSATYTSEAKISMRRRNHEGRIGAVMHCIRRQAPSESRHSKQ